MKKILILIAVSISVALGLGMLDHETQSLSHLLSAPGNIAGLTVWSLIFFAFGGLGWWFVTEMRSL